MFKKINTKGNVFLFSLLQTRIPSKEAKGITGMQNLSIREDIQQCLVQIPVN